MRNFFVLLVLSVSVMLSGCGYNHMQSADEQVKANWSEVLSQYKRRADLIPNLVATVKGYAQHEQDTLTQVTQARARATSINATPELVNDPDAFKKFETAQQGLTGALSKLMVVSERYPDLKANQNFRDLQAQLEGTENRITVARHRYIESIQQYNTLVRQFPGVITARIMGYKPKPNFDVPNEDQVSNAPSVDFGGDAKAQ